MAMTCISGCRECTGCLKCESEEFDEAHEAGADYWAELEYDDRCASEIVEEMIERGYI